ncbi:MAG TPA: helix-turn-helix domain-containing protein [Methylomirabilota bacterium]|nr:helix-turn-helix domain-containing protein [Methylomirabilota bacterium]
MRGTTAQAPQAHEQLDFDSLMFGADRRVLLVSEVAAKLRVTEQHVLDLIEEGQLQAINIGGADRKYWRIPVEAWRAFTRSRHSFNL